MSDDFKQRYLDLAEQHETELERHRTLEQLLTRTIVRLTLATSGLDPVLDPHLTRLRDTVRKGVTPALQQQLAELSEALIRAGDEAAGDGQGEGSEDDLRRLLRRLAAGKGIDRHLRRLLQELLAESGPIGDSRLDELTLLLTERSSGGGDRGLLGRLLGGGHDETDPGAHLLTLIDELTWPEQMADEIPVLRRRLKDGGKEGAWRGVLADLAGLLSRVVGEVQREMQATEGFLQELSQRLEEIDRNVQRSQAGRQASLDSGSDLDRSVKEEMGQIQDSMRRATSLPEMRQAISSHLDTIQAHVDAHVQAEAERQREAIEQEQRLRQRIQEIERESMELRRRMLDARQRALTDPVTGLPNRAAYEERLRHEVARWRRFGEPLVMAVWDLDDFKQINDRFGHQAGDKALRVIGSILQRRLRQTDFVGRYGGEEFVMLLTGAPLEQALEVADTIRQAVEESGFHTSDGREIRLTISCGLSQFHDGDQPEQVFKRADSALYRAKREGKNRCIVE